MTLSFLGLGNGTSVSAVVDWGVHSVFKNCPKPGAAMPLPRVPEVVCPLGNSQGVFNGKM